MLFICKGISFCTFSISKNNYINISDLLDCVVKPNASINLVIQMEQNFNISMV